MTAVLDGVAGPTATMQRQFTPQRELWLHPAGGLLVFCALAWQLGWWPLLAAAALGAITVAQAALAVRESRGAERGGHAHTWVERTAARIAARAGLPAPKVCVWDERERPRGARLYNAAAFRFGGHSEVFLTPRLAEERAVLPAVLAHETGHLRAGAAPTLVLVSLRRACIAVALLWGVGTAVGTALQWEGGRSVSEVITLLAWALGLVAAGYAYAAWASRSDEFAADQDAAALTSPAEVAGALDRIVRLEEPDGWLPSPWVLQLFSSHPTVEQRIRRLERLQQAWTGEASEFVVPPTVYRPEDFPLGPDEGLDEPDIPMAAKAVLVPSIGALRVLTAYVGVASLVWLASLPWDRPPVAIGLGALFIAASGVAGWLLQRGLEWWAQRQGPAWDAWGNPAWPGRRALGAGAQWLLRSLLAAAALVAATNTGMALWHPAIAYYALAGLAVLTATQPLARDRTPLLRLEGREPAPSYTPSGRARAQALHLIGVSWSIVLALCIVAGQFEAVKVVAVIAVGSLAVTAVLWPVRPLRRGEADTTPGGPPPPGYQPVRPVPRPAAGGRAAQPSDVAEEGLGDGRIGGPESDRTRPTRKARCTSCGSVRRGAAGSTARCGCGARLRIPAPRRSWHSAAR